MLQYLPNSNSSLIKVGVITYGDTEYYSEKIGTLNVVDSNPIFSNFSYKDTDTNIIKNLTGDNQTIIKGYSDVQGIISLANKAIAQNYSTMSKYRFSIDEKTKEAQYSDKNEVTITIANVLSNKFTMYAMDSRENSTSKEILAKKYIEYYDITIKELSVFRENDVGTKTILKFNGDIWNGNFGIKNNSISQCYYKYKNTTTESDWSDKIYITPTKDGNIFYFNSVIAGDLGAEGFDADESYEIQVFIADAISNNFEKPMDFILGPGTPGLALYKNKIAIGGRYDEELGGTLQVYGDIYQNGENTNKKEVLYSNQSGTTGTITLSKDISNFKEIELSFFTNNDFTCNIRANIENSKKISFSIPNVYTASSVFQFVVAAFSVNGTSLIWDWTSYININHDKGSFIGSNINYIKVTKVIGYK